MKLENGRPENTEGRLEKEIRVYDFLDKLGRVTSHSRQRICRHRSVLPDFPLQSRSIWRSIWILHRDLSALWDL